MLPKRSTNASRVSVAGASLNRWVVSQLVMGIELFLVDLGLASMQTRRIMLYFLRIVRLEIQLTIYVYK